MSKRRIYDDDIYITGYTRNSRKYRYVKSHYRRHPRRRQSGSGVAPVRGGGLVVFGGFLLVGIIVSGRSTGDIIARIIFAILVITIVFVFKRYSK